MITLRILSCLKIGYPGIPKSIGLSLFSLLKWLGECTGNPVKLGNMFVGGCKPQTVWDQGENPLIIKFRKIELEEKRSMVTCLESTVNLMIVDDQLCAARGQT